MKAPQLVFFCGPNSASKTKLAKQFAAKFTPLATLTLSMGEPLRDAAAGLFYDGNHLKINEKTWGDIPPPFNLGTSTGDFMRSVESLLRSHYGESALGNLALINYRDSGYEDRIAHTIYNDVDNPHDMQPFIEHYGKSSCLCVNVGPLTLLPLWREIKCIWLAQPTVASQLLELTRELSDPHTRNTSHASTDSTA